MSRTASGPFLWTLGRSFRYGEGMTKRTVLYDLGALIQENLLAEIPEMAELLGHAETEVEAAVQGKADEYATGRITQGEYWSDVAARLLLEDLEVPATYALRNAVVDTKLLGYIRAQSPVRVIGLVSDATPDWVGHWRKLYGLDKLFAVHIIDSELGTHHSYVELLKLAAERLQSAPSDVSFLDRTPAHLEAARNVDMTVLDLREGTLREIMANVPDPA